MKNHGKLEVPDLHVHTIYTMVPVYILYRQNDSPKTRSSMILRKRTARLDINTNRDDVQSKNARKVLANISNVRGETIANVDWGGMEEGCARAMHGRGRRIIDPRLLTMLRRSAPGFHRPGRHCLHQARSAVRCWSSRMKGALHPTENPATGEWGGSLLRSFPYLLFASPKM